MWALRNVQSGEIRPVSERGLRIGRAVGNDLVLADEEVSRYHATVWVHGGQVYIRDENSTNGTWVNERRITAPTLLRPGDRVRLGKTVLEMVRQEPGATVLSMPAPSLAFIPPASSPFPPAAPSPPVSAAPPRRWVRSPLFWVLVSVGVLLFLCTPVTIGLLLIQESRQAVSPPIPNPVFTPFPTRTPSPFYRPTPFPTRTPSSFYRPTPVPVLGATPVPASSGPFWINGTRVTFRSARKSDQFTALGETFTPTHDWDTFLIVEADVPSGQYDWDRISEWPLVLNDYIEPSFRTGEFPSGKLTWVFLVHETETTFILTLPDGTRVNLTRSYAELFPWR